MFKISSIIIAKNESANIESCIESQLACIDEIVVLVDDRTSDNTYELASKYEKVICKKVPWMGFSKTKQYAVELTNNDWIFWIDADERIRKELSDELNELKKTNLAYNVYSVARRAYFLNKWIKYSGWYPARVNRLFNKNDAKFSESEVHEYLVFNGKIGELKNDLDHYTDPDLFHYMEKFNSYTTLAAKQLITKNKKVNILELFLRPIFMFIKMYILKRGFLDGKQGFILALLSSGYVFTKYTKLWEIKQQGN